LSSFFTTTATASAPYINTTNDYVVILDYDVRATNIFLITPDNQDVAIVHCQGGVIAMTAPLRVKPTLVPPGWGWTPDVDALIGTFTAIQCDTLAEALELLKM